MLRECDFQDFWFGNFTKPYKNTGFFFFYVWYRNSKNVFSLYRVHSWMYSWSQLYGISLSFCWSTYINTFLMENKNKNKKKSLKGKCVECLNIWKWPYFIIWLVVWLGKQLHIKNNLKALFHCVLAFNVIYIL